MNRRPVVSIIVPCYNQAQYLGETLNSVIIQTYGEWECIVVNDGSPDNTEDVAQVYCKKDSRIKYLYQENQGVAMARNNGIRQSMGKYILPLDADDLILPEYLSSSVEIMDEGEYKVVYSLVERFGSSGGLWKMSSYDYDTIIWGNMIPCTAMYRREDFDKTSGYNPNMKFGYEDWDFWLSLLDRDSKVFRVEKPLFLYRSKPVSRAVLND